MVDFIDTSWETEWTNDGEQVALVELHSIGWLCEPDLTWSSHILIVTYKTGEKVAQIIDAGAFQKKSNIARNAMFEEIYKRFRVSGIILTHDHFDHSGRLVSLHKAICGHHKLPDLPIYTSHPSRQLLPHVLQSYNMIQDTNTWVFDDACARFFQSFSAFWHSYAARPKKETPGRKDHRSHGDKMLDAHTTKTKAINELKKEFFANGWEKRKGELMVPREVKDKKTLHSIMRAIKALYKNESDKYSANEQYKINKVRESLACLGIWSHISECFEDIFADEVPRTDRKWRYKQIDLFTKYIKKEIESHRETLLPEIMPEDITRVLQNSHGLEENRSYNIPWLPGVKMSLHPTGHMLWSVAVKFVFKMVGDRVNSLLFSGDIGRFWNNSLHGDPVVLKVDKSVSETTYAGREHPEKWPEIDSIIDFVRKQSWPILMPVFALDRMHVVLNELREQIMWWQINCPIFCRNNLGEATADIYKAKYPKLVPVINKIKFIGGEEAHTIMRWDKKCIMIASGGTMQDTSSANNLLTTRVMNGSDPKIILTWYQPAGVGKVLMEFYKWTDDPKATVNIYLNDGSPCEIKRKNILLTGIFSGHGDHDDLLEYAAWSGEVLLIHGSEEWAQIMQADLEERKIKASIVKRGKTITLFDGQAA